MLDPELTRRVVHGMVRRVTATPITVKCRIGADDHDSYEHLVKFVAGVQSAGVKEIAVHARKCLLKGLCPRQNRTIPPLRYDVVRQLKADFPELTIVLNGGIKNMSDVMGHLQWQGREEDECPGATVDGVMVGRAAYQDTWSFATTDSLLFGEQSDPASSRRAVIDSYMDYVESYLESSDPNPKFKIETLVKPLQGIFHGLSGSKRFRGSLFAGLREISWSDGSANVREVLDRSLEHMPASVLLDPPGVTWTRTGADGEGRSPRMNE
jgi:tRNA-dihydrouridine synthase A